MADYTSLIATSVATNTQTDVTAGGIAVGGAGTYSLNLCNDADVVANVSAIAITPSGVASPTAAHKVQPAFQIEVRGRELFQPIKLGEGWKVWITSDQPIAVQLVGDKEG